MPGALAPNPRPVDTDPLHCFSSPRPATHLWGPMAGSPGKGCVRRRCCEPGTVPAAEKEAACERTLRPGRTILRPGVLHPIGRQPVGVPSGYGAASARSVRGSSHRVALWAGRERLHIAAPTLSELIRRLERE